jgi:hypothetical protein
MNVDASSVALALERMGSSKVEIKGSKVTATCPFASMTHAKGRDRNPSFVVSIGGSHGGGFVCKACGMKGSLLGLGFHHSQKFGVDNSWFREMFKETDPTKIKSKFDSMEYESLLERRRSVYSPWLREGKPRFELENFQGYLGKLPRYAESRGISFAQADKWKLGYDHDRKRLFIPIFDCDGHMVGWAGRAIKPDQKPKYFNSPGFDASNHLFGEAFVNIEEGCVVLVESFMDVFRLDRLGIPNCVANFGASFSTVRAKRLLDWGLPVVIFPHQDEAGEDGTVVGMQMAINYKTFLEKRGVKVHICPYVGTYKDVDEMPDDVALSLFKEASCAIGLEVS